MEKQRCKSISIFSRRLLILPIVFTGLLSLLFPQNLSIDDFNSLIITPTENQQFFSKSDIKYEVSIPKISPSQIQILSFSLPNDIELQTMRKIDDFDNGGTKIELWYHFENKGTYQLPPLPVLIQNKRRTLKHSPITIIDDPSKQSPQLIVIFSNGIQLSSKNELSAEPVFKAKVGQKQTFTVYVQYVSQVVQFAWDLPKDSIFTQTKSYDITEVRYREKEYTHALIPVASFEWTGLKTGLLQLAKLKTVVTDYNGYRSELFLPECFIEFTENRISVTEASEKIFDDAFTQNKSTETEAMHGISTENCEKLAQLYSIERNALSHFSQKHKNRVDYEADLGLPQTSVADFTLGLLHIFIALTIIILILLLIFIRKKKFITILILSAFLIISLVPLVNLTIKRNDKYAISKGCFIRSIPEENSDAVLEIGPGNRVHIVEEAGRWIYIEFGETGGWGLKDNVIFIK